jgi:hypothetical protein
MAIESTLLNNVPRALRPPGCDRLAIRWPLLNSKLDRQMKTLEKLVGLRMWGTNHMAESRGFSFGARRESLSSHGRRRVVGDYALHIQCPWRIVRGDGGEITGSDVPAEEATLVLTEHLGEEGHIVRRATFGERGVRLELEGGMFLEISPFLDDPDEVLRLFRPGVDEPHVVWYGNGPGHE